MGIVIDFPSREAASPSRAASGGGWAQIVILPVIRIERHDDEPTTFMAPPNKGDASRKRGKRI